MMERLGGLTVALLAVAALAMGPTEVRADDDLVGRIARAGDAKDYPGADMVVVLDRSVVQIAADGLATTNRIRLLKILTDGGVREQSVQQFDFDPLTNRFQVKAIRIHRAEGGVDSVDLKYLQTAPSPAGTIFWGGMFQTVSLPRLEVNDCVELVTTKTGFNLAYLDKSAPGPVVGAATLEPPMAGHWHDTVYFQESYPIIEKAYIVRAPREKPIQYEVCHGQIQASVQFKGQMTEYSFVAKDAGIVPGEPRALAFGDKACKLVLTTVEDWIAKSKWFHDANVGQFESTPEIKAKVDEIIAGIEDDTEKMRAINCWVADNIRYVGTTRGPCEGYTMHSGVETFRDRGGVCKDKAGMAVTMLRAAGFDSFPVMTQAGSEVEATPADQFNHAVTTVRNADGSLLLLDPTWAPKSRELWSSRECLQHVIFGIPEGHELARSPYFPPEHNKIECESRGLIDQEGRLEIHLNYELANYPDTNFRRGVTRARKPDQRALVESWLAPLGGRYTMTKLKHSNPTDYQQNSKIDASVQVDAYVLGTGPMRMFRLPLLQHPFGQVFMADVLQEVPKNEDRQFGMKMRTTRLLNYSDTLDLPRGWVVEQVPENVEIDNDAARLVFKTETRDNALHYELEVAVKQHIILADNYQDYYEVNKKLLELRDAWIMCKPGESQSTPVADAHASAEEVTR